MALFKRKAQTHKKSSWLIVMLYWMGWLGAVIFLTFLARVTSVQFAVIMGSVFLFLFFMAIEFFSRRAFQKKIMHKMNVQDHEYTRLVREIARNRNELSQLKKGLGDAGRAASKAAEGRLRNSVEERMLSNIAEQLTNIGNMARPEAGSKPLSEEKQPRVSEEQQEKSWAEIAPPLTEDDAFASQLTALPMPGDDEILKMLRDAVDDDRIDVFLQPVVSLPQRKLRYFEMFSRIRMKNQEYIPARRYIHLAMKADLLPAIDNLLLLRALQLIRDIDFSGQGERGYFCNITPLTLADSKFMGDLVEFISQNRHLASRLIFELAHDDMIDPSVVTPEINEVLNGLAHLGCRFSIEGVNPAVLDMDMVRAKHVRYIKLESHYMLERLDERAGFSRLKRLKSELDRRGIDLIVTHIEQERQLVELLDLEIDYGQGYLFGEPEKSDIL